MRTFAVIALAAILSGCSSAPPPKKAEKKAPVPMTARHAFQQAFISSRTWAQDLQLLRARDVAMSEVKTVPGESAVWEFTFVSPSKAKSRTYVVSAIESGNIHEGVMSGPESDWSGRDGQATAFPTIAFKIDSTDAWKTALEKSDEYAKKNPDAPVTFLLEKTPRFPDPSWRVIWGVSVAASSYSVFIDVVTGDYQGKAL